MAHLQYFSYPGYGEIATEKYWYSQAVRIGDRIEASGQGGWDPKTGRCAPGISFRDEVDQAFANVDLTLKHAGGKGWSQVFRVNIYTLDLGEESLEAMVSSMKKWMPNHQPLWTVVGVTQLGQPEMRVEVEVAAHLGD
ncbi:hypothetical protein V5O48_019072 [Marasmius crinis-equi]|uniref:Uncharacterized protein n=1 Tax=Marasmius crinis-equi TaxID=585013 RepID=A0ABR3EJE7_9AGAR